MRTDYRNGSGSSSTHRNGHSAQLDSRPRPALHPGVDGPDQRVAAEAELKYQLKAFWDLKDETGTTVAPGDYTIRGRFYLYYDPIVEITLTVDEPAP